MRQSEKQYWTLSVIYAECWIFIVMLSVLDFFLILENLYSDKEGGGGGRGIELSVN